MSSEEQFERLFDNKLQNNEARDFLISLYQKGESANDIALSASIMRQHSIKLPISDTLRNNSIDIVGTGGDRSGSFNISSTVSLLLSSIGSVVAKHGNRSVTSSSGSADLLEELGINLNLSPDNQVKMLEECGFCFIFAINHHPVMKHIMPIRKSIEHRTIFNLLGPLTNPVGAKKYLLGVFDPSFIDIMAEALIKLGTKNAYIVSSSDGMDEISISTTTPFAYIKNNIITRDIIDPESNGFKIYPKEQIIGGNAKDNAKITKDIFKGVEKGAKRDIVLINASYALVADERARDIQEAREILIDALD
nr:anthranilate phosphoribosyltransferase [Sulfurovaceae bacterium]